MWADIEVGLARYQMLLERDKYLPAIIAACQSVIKDAQVYLTGSVLRGEAVAGSDVDLLVVGNIPPSHYEQVVAVAEIEERALLPMVHPFEFHLLSEDGFTFWQKIFGGPLKKLSK